MRRNHLLFSLLAVASACMEPVGSATEPIVRAMPSSDPAVVAVLVDATSPSAMICTGTMIHERLLVTAKHCVQEEGASSPVATSRIVAVMRERVGGAISPGELFEIERVDAPAGAWRGDDNSLQGQDLAVLTIRGSWAGTPCVLRRTQPDEMVGTTGRIVGYGQSDLSTYGQRNETSAMILSVESTVIVTEPRTCPGDSGGPLFAEDATLLGVLSTAGGSAACGRGVQSRFEPVSAHLKTIDGAAARIGATLPSRIGEDAGVPIPGDDGAGVVPPPVMRERSRGCGVAPTAQSDVVDVVGTLFMMSSFRRRRRRKRAVASTK
jgi:V8-like Glu-specific endopeptidase